MIIKEKNSKVHKCILNKNIHYERTSEHICKESKSMP